MDKIRVLLFPMDTYDRYGYLDECNENELVQLLNEDADVFEYTLKEFQNECNNGEIDLDVWWIYFVSSI